MCHAAFSFEGWMEEAIKMCVDVHMCQLIFFWGGGLNYRDGLYT